MSHALIALASSLGTAFIMLGEDGPTRLGLFVGMVLAAFAAVTLSIISKDEEDL